MDRARARAVRTAGAALLAAGLTAALATSGAAAKGGGGGGGAGVVAGHTITVLPDTSALELSGFPGSTTVQIDVTRDGVQLANATLTTDAAGDGAMNGGTMDRWADAAPHNPPGGGGRGTGPDFGDTKTGG